MSEKVICPMCDELTSTEDKTEDYWCPSCKQVVEEPDKKYECGNCGTIFTRNNSADGCSHRCPDCNKFGSTVAENGCPDCDDETDLEEVTIITCEKCGEQFPLSDATPEEPDKTKPHKLAVGDHFKQVDKDGNLVRLIRIDKVKNGKPDGMILAYKPSMALWDLGDSLTTNPFVGDGFLDAKETDLSQYIYITPDEENKIHVEVNNKSIEFNKAELQKNHYLYQCPDCKIIKPIPKAKADAYEKDNDSLELYCHICRSIHGLVGKGTDYHKMVRVG